MVRNLLHLIFRKLQVFENQHSEKYTFPYVESKTKHHKVIADLGTIEDTKEKIFTFHTKKV